MYRFCKQYPYLVFAIKGSSQKGKPIVSRPTRSNLGRVNLYPVGTDTAKATFYSYLNIETPEPGFCHFPKSDVLGNYSADLPYFQQLTAEQQVTKSINGRSVLRFEKSANTMIYPADYWNCLIYSQ